MEQSQENVLERQKLMSSLGGFFEGAGQCHTQFIGEVHSGSVVQRRGYPDSRAKRIVLVALASAISPE
jgi:hypothetical protein